MLTSVNNLKHLFQILVLLKVKLAEMATSAYAGESATYRAAKNIEDRIAIREASGNTHQEAELKGVEEYAIECSILKVAVSEDVQNVQMKEFKFLAEWDFLKKHQWKLLGEMHVLHVSMKELTKLTECYLLAC